MKIGDNSDALPPPNRDRGKSASLPNAELNPTANPLLAANLGRWAQIYFTTPPQKREQAIRALLEQLKSAKAFSPDMASSQGRLRTDGKQVDVLKAGASQRETAASEKDKAKHKPIEHAEEKLVCPACLHKNEGTQRFCGFCGFLLRADQLPTEPAQLPGIHLEPPSAQDRDATDWAWLREKNLADLTIARRKSSPGKYLIALAALLVLVIAGYVLWWKGEAASSAVEATPKIEQPTPTRVDPDLAAHANSAAQMSGPGKQANTRPSTIAATNSSAGEQSAGIPKTPASQNSGNDGKEELEQGRRYLEGRTVPRNTVQAATWLWKAVSKKNVEATLLLSDLYVRGDGVPQSCEQALVLLRAAADRGSSIAKEKLSTVEYSMCR